jgi:hypothetical protein
VTSWGPKCILLKFACPRGCVEVPALLLLSGGANDTVVVPAVKLKLEGCFGSPSTLPEKEGSAICGVLGVGADWACDVPQLAALENWGAGESKDTLGKVEVDGRLVSFASGEDGGLS